MGILLLIALAAIIFLYVLASFIFKPQNGILLIFLIGVSVQYLEHLKLGSFTVLDIAGIGIPFLIFLGLFFCNKNLFYEFKKNILIKYFCFFLLLLLFCGVLFSGTLYPTHTYLNLFERFSKWFKLVNCFIIMYAVSIYFKDVKDVNKLIAFMLLSLIIPGILFIWQLATGDLVRNLRTGYSVPDTFFHHPAVYAYALIYHFPICLFKLFQRQKFSQYLFWCLVAFAMLVLIYFTYRRGVWLGLFTQIIVFFLLTKQVRIKLLSTYMLIPLIAALIFFQIHLVVAERLFDIYTFFSNFHDVIYTTQYNYLFSGRWGFFRENLIYLTSQPLINLFVGNGIGATTYVSIREGLAFGNHNNFLILLVDYGLLCFSGYLILIYLVLSSLIKAFKSSDRFLSLFSKSLIALIIGDLVMGMVVHTLYANATNWLLWGNLGAMLGYIHTQGMIHSYSETESEDLAYA